MNDLDCFACGGKRRTPAGAVCPACDGRGIELIRSCPKPMVTADVRAVLASADFARKGILPVAGGSLDQAQGAMDAIRMVWNFEASLRAQYRVRDD